MFADIAGRGDRTGTVGCLAEVVVTIFDASKQVVGEGIIDTRTDRPAVQDLAVLAERRFDFAIRRGVAGGGIDQRTVDGVAGAQPCRTIQACGNLAGDNGFVAPGVTEIALDAENDGTGNFEIIARETGKTAAVKFMLRGNAKSRRLDPVPAVTRRRADLNTIPGKGRRNVVGGWRGRNVADGIGGSGHAGENAEQAEREK